MGVTACHTPFHTCFNRCKEPRRWGALRLFAFFYYEVQRSNKAKPSATPWNKEIRNAYENRRLPAIFYYEAQRSNKAKPSATPWNKEIRNAYESGRLPAIFYYEAQRSNKAKPAANPWNKKDTQRLRERAATGYLLLRRRGELCSPGTVFARRPG